MTNNVPHLPSLLRSAYSQRENKVFRTINGEPLDRTKYVSASEASSCLRMLKFNKTVGTGRPNTLDELGFAERGHAIEAWVNQLMSEIKGDVEILYYGDDQVSLTRGVQSGTPDGIIKTAQGVWVLDIKSIDPRTNRTYLPKHANVMQIQQNIFLVRETFDTEVIGGIVLYVDCSNVDDMLQINLEPDEQVIYELQKRASRVMQATSPDELPAEGVLTENGCRFCAHTARCSEFVSEHKKQEVDRDALVRALEKAGEGLDHVFG